MVRAGIILRNVRLFLARKEVKDMYISNREKVILNLLLNQKNGVTIDYLSEKLDVSTRTVYRELSSLESTLAQYQIKLDKEAEGYYLLGKQASIDELKIEMNGSPEELTTKKRQRLLVTRLLLEDREMKMESLAYDLNVSIGTIQLDLQSIEEMFEEYNIKVIRKKAIGIKVSSPEPNLRLIVSGLITSEVNEYNFFHLFTRDYRLDKERYKQSHNPFLKIIDPVALELAFRAVKQYDRYQFEEVTDTQFQSLVLFLALTIERIKQKRYIQKEELSVRSKETSRDKSIKLSTELLETLKKDYSFNSFPQEEVAFFAVQIEGLNVPLRNEFSEEYDLELSYKVRELIWQVSKETNIDFQQDQTLFQDLLAHLSAAVHRNKAPMPESSNPLLEKIYQEYTELSHTVGKGIERLFPDNQFHSNETLYVVIHFASAYERNPKSQSLKVLIICSSGIGTAKILENRLRKNVSEITSVDISRISQLHQMNYDKYDLILSTIFLQGFEEDYKVVTPLLMEDELKSIKRYVKQIIETKIKKRYATEKISLKQDAHDVSFQEFYSKVTDINRILKNFDVVTVPSKKSLRETLQVICESLSETTIENPNKVANKLENRMEAAPIGLPNTGMALFHCIDDSIKHPYFGIFDITNNFEIINMEKKVMQLNRVLLLLAPEPMDEQTQDIMGAISASIVENNFQMKMYDSGEKEMIQQYLSGLFLSKMK